MLQQLDLSFSQKPHNKNWPCFTTSQAQNSNPGKLLELLEKAFNKPIELRFTQNRSTMLSFREEKHAYKLRMHERFLTANTIEIQALADYLQSKNKASGQILDAFINRIAQNLPTKYPKLRAKGRFFDLHELFYKVNAEHFYNLCSAQITWGQGQRKKRRKTIQLGLYYYDENIIVIHPALDQSFVPEYYLCWIIYHEMLHEVFGYSKEAKRQQVHPPEFIALEESFPCFQECKTWEAHNLNRLLNYKPNN